MKYKTIYGSNNDDFILKIKRVYNPIEKLHLKLAKWHLRKILKINKESIDYLYNKACNDIIKEINYRPTAVTSFTAKQIIDKIKEFKLCHINQM